MSDPNAPTPEDIKLQKEMIELRKQLGDLDNEIIEKLAKANIEREKEKIISADSLTNLNRRIGILQQINEEEENQAVRRARQKEIEELLTKHKKDQLSLDEQKLQKMMDAEDVASEEYQALKKKIMEQKKALKAEQILNKQKEEGLGIQQNIVKSISGAALGSSKFGKALAGGIDGMFKMAKGARNLQKAIQAGAVSMSMLTAATGIGIILLIVGAVFKLVEWMLKLAIQTRDATVAFQRSTGALEKFGAQVPRVEHAMRAVGVSMEEASAAQMALYTSTTDYTMASDEARDSLLKTTALMGEFGVSVETSSKIAQAATKGLGIGIGGADELLLSLSAHAQDIGVPINKMMNDFAAASDELKVFGRDGEQVFKRLAMVSKITGMEVGRILDIVGKFDTFEGAAKQAGQLNAAIGGNMVNAMDLMMTTDPEARFNMIRDSIMNAAGSFDSMTYYQKRFYAQAAGLKDVGELAALMSGDMKSLDGNIGMTSKSYKEQREQAKNWQDTMSILKNTLATMAPMFETLSKKIQEMLAEFSKGEGPLRKIGELFGKLFEDATIELIKDMPAKIGNFVTKLEDLADYLKPIPGYVEDVVWVAKILGTVFAMALTGIAVALLPITLGFKAVAAIIFGVGLAVSWLIGLFKQKNSPSFLDLFTGGVLAKGLKTVKDAMQIIIGPIKKVANVFKSLGETIANTFNFDNIKETVSGFVDWLPGEWGKSVDGVKAEMEIASPSRKMEREVINPTFVEPMKSVAGKMPGMVNDVYAGVDLSGITKQMSEKGGQITGGTSLLGINEEDLRAGLEKDIDAMTLTLSKAQAEGIKTTAEFKKKMLKESQFEDDLELGPKPPTPRTPASPQFSQTLADKARQENLRAKERNEGSNTTTVLEKTHQNITIPINIGGNEIGTLVADIVEGKIGNISLKGALGIG